MAAALHRISGILFATCLLGVGANYATGGASKGPWAIAVPAVLGLFLLVWLATTEPILRRVLRGPHLVTGEIGEETRNAIGGPDLQVITVPIFNNRDAGGERATARDVYPKLEAFNAHGTRVATTKANWLPDHTGQAPSTVTFRPTHQEHGLEIVGKFPGGRSAWLAGESDPPSLHEGSYVVRATLRGDNLHRPAVFEWDVVNPGIGGKLLVSPKWRTHGLKWRGQRALWRVRRAGQRLRALDR